ncbi:MAG: hypothetical protein L3J71_10115 [Victivallaceae bacterium]|nr:hypothetical protein [Victivallaceae bacterium]
MKDKHYSANFKKDYLAYFAIGLFFVVVAIELYMAIWLPVYLKSQDRWAIQENRQEMLDLFDGLRRKYKKLKLSNQQGKDEVAVLVNCLDRNAIYLREYQKELNLDQIKALNSDYQVFDRFFQVYRRKNDATGKYDASLGKKRQLETVVLLKKLKLRAESRLKAQTQQYNKNGYIE